MSKPPLRYGFATGVCSVMFRERKDPVVDRREDILDKLGDIKYSVIWSVEVNQDNTVGNIELSHILEFPNSSIVSGFKPSDVFVRKAKQKISELVWSNPNNNKNPVSEQVATCYLLNSNPDEPYQCSNNLER